MIGLLLKNHNQYYSFFRETFNKISTLSTEYNWLISGIECYPVKAEYQKLFSSRYVWISGERLLEILQDEDIQWIWGVFSGFEKNVTLQQILVSKVPFADGNKSFWQLPLKIEHPLATIEIVAWDSSCSLFISSNDATIREFSKLYPLAIDLEQYNQKANKVLTKESGRTDIR